MITEAYVNFETAKLLKEKGFDEPCKVWYAEYTSVWGGDPSGDRKYSCIQLDDKNEFDESYKFLCYAPTLQMAMKWLREIHNIHIELNPICTGDSSEDLEWHYGWAVKTTIFIDRWKRHDAERISYEQACEAAIKYCLENLI